MDRMYMVVADDAAATIYDTANGLPTVVEIIDHPRGRMDVREYKSDVPGTGRSDHGGHAYGLAPRTPPQETERERFTRHLAARLDQAVSSGHATRLALVMAPRLLGSLRSHLAPRTAKAVVCELRHRRVDRRPEEVAAEVAALGETALG